MRRVDGSGQVIVAEKLTGGFHKWQSKGDTDMGGDQTMVPEEGSQGKRSQNNPSGHMRYTLTWGHLRYFQSGLLKK